MDHERDGSDNHEHHGSDGVEDKTDVYDETIGESEPGNIEYLELLTHALSVDESGIAREEICEGYNIGNDCQGTISEDTESTG